MHKCSRENPLMFCLLFQTLRSLSFPTITENAWILHTKFGHILQTLD